MEDKRKISLNVRNWQLQRNQKNNLTSQKFKEEQDVLKQERSASAPGQNVIQYRVNKNYPKLTKRLRVVWIRRKMIDAWYKAEVCFIPKEKTSRKCDQFRTIFLLNIEGKIFRAVLAKRTTRSLQSNEYIDLSVQK